MKETDRRVISLQIVGIALLHVVKNMEEPFKYSKYPSTRNFPIMHCNEMNAIIVVVIEP